ncbi:MAG TPA: DUF2007 domain-containing protein [Methyloversatilis sp.]
MRTLYEAANGVDARLLHDLLAQEGVPALVCGEFLQGGIGELPAAGLVRLMVDERDYAAGRALIARWESGPACGDWNDVSWSAGSVRTDAADVSPGPGLLVLVLAVFVLLLLST